MIDKVLIAMLPLANVMHVDPDDAQKGDDKELLSEIRFAIGTLSCTWLMTSNYY